MSGCSPAFLRGCASLTQTSLADDMNWVSDECMVNATKCWDPTEKPGVGAMARPNTPLFGVLGGIRQYATLGIPADKLVIALPCTRI